MSAERQIAASNSSDVQSPVCLRISLVGVATRVRVPAAADAGVLSSALELRDIDPKLPRRLDGGLATGVVNDGSAPRVVSAGEEREGPRGGGPNELAKFCRARPSSTLRARDANSREHFVSEEFSAAGETLTTMSVLLFPPRESSRRRVSWRGQERHCTC